MTNVSSVVCWLQRIISLHLIPKTANHLWREQSIWKPHFFRPGWYHLSWRRAWSQAMEDLLPHWVPHVFSLHCHRVSREAAHQPHCRRRRRPTARVFPCVRKSTVTSDSRRCCGLPEITLWGRGSALHGKEANDRTGNHSRTAACSLDLPIWLWGLSHLLWTWTRRGKFMNSPAHWINLLWHPIFQAASAADLKPGQHHRSHLEEEHPHNVPISHSYFFMLTEEDLGSAKAKCRTSEKYTLHFFSWCPDFRQMPEAGSIKFLLFTYIPDSCGTQEIRPLPSSFSLIASRSESGSWPESVHQQLSARGVAAAHTVMWHPAPFGLSMIDNNTCQNQILRVKRTF